MFKSHGVQLFWLAAGFEGEFFRVRGRSLKFPTVFGVCLSDRFLSKTGCKYHFFDRSFVWRAGCSAAYWQALQVVPGGGEHFLIGAAAGRSFAHSKS